MICRYLPEPALTELLDHGFGCTVPLSCVADTPAVSGALHAVMANVGELQAALEVAQAETQSVRAKLHNAVRKGKELQRRLAAAEEAQPAAPAQDASGAADAAAQAEQRICQLQTSEAQLQEQLHSASADRARAEQQMQQQLTELQAELQAVQQTGREAAQAAAARQAADAEAARLQELMAAAESRHEQAAKQAQAELQKARASAAASAGEAVDLQRQVRQLMDSLAGARQHAEQPAAATLQDDGLVTSLRSRVAELEARAGDAAAQQSAADGEAGLAAEGAKADAAKAAWRAAAAEATAATLRSEVEMLQEALQTAAMQVLCCSLSK